MVVILWVTEQLLLTQEGPFSLELISDSQLYKICDGSDANNVAAYYVGMCIYIDKSVSLHVTSEWNLSQF